MNTIAASQKNRRERIAEAMRIEWRGLTDQYSADLWASLLHAINTVQPGEAEIIHFGGSTHTLTLTELEDLCELVRQSYHALQEARATR